MSRKWAVWLGLAIACAGAGACAQQVRHFKSWTAVCDNLNTCAAFGYADSDANAGAFIRVRRAAGPQAEPSVVVKVQSDDQDAGAGALRLAVDGRTPRGLGALAAAADANGALAAQLSPPQTHALLDALRNGVSLSIAGDKLAAAISLAGSSAALLWIDDRQGRIGAVGAMAARGRRPDAAAPAPPRLRAAPAISQAGLPDRLPAAILANRGLQACDSADALSQAATIARLGPGQVLWGAPCSAGAYNVLDVLFIADERGRGAREIDPPDAQAGDPNADDELMNIDYDPKTRILSSFAKARGLGDCGAAARWVWDGQAFRLLDETVMPDCQGVTSDDWPSFYHAVLAP